MNDPIRDPEDKNGPRCETKIDQTTKPITSAQRDETEIYDSGSEQSGKPITSIILGFIRTFNFMAATAAIILVIINIWNNIDTHYNMRALNLTQVRHDSSHGYDYMGIMATETFILLAVTVLLYVDNMTTTMFHWKEYGMVSTRDTDSTSILLNLQDSRHVIRIYSAVIISTAPLQLHHCKDIEFIHNNSYLYFTLIIITFSAIPMILLTLIIQHFSRQSNIPWLQGHLNTSAITDENNIWQTMHQTKVNSRKKCQQRGYTIITTIVESIKITALYLVNLTSIVTSMTNIGCANLTAIENPTDITMQAIYFYKMSIFSIIIFTNILVLAKITFDTGQMQQCSIRKQNVTRMTYIISLYILMTNYRQLISQEITGPNQEVSNRLMNVLKLTKGYLQIYAPHLIGVCVLHIMFSISTEYNRLYKFAKINFNRKKIYRIADLTANILILTGSMTTTASLLTGDQYDIIFNQKEFVQDIQDAIAEFKHDHRVMMLTMTRLINSFDFDLTCEKLYTILATATSISTLLTLLPFQFTGKISSIGMKATYQVTTITKRFSDLAKSLKKILTDCWSIINATIKFSLYITHHWKKITMAYNVSTLIRIVQTVPIFFLGTTTFFETFFPDTLIFFNTMQRLKHFNNRIMHWNKAIIAISAIYITHMTISQQLVELLDYLLPYAEVHLEYKLSTYLLMIGTTLSLLGATIKLIFAIQNKHTYKNDHEVITQKEKSWKKELEQRNLQTITTPFGDTYQAATHVKYTRQQLSPTKYIVPITLTVMACICGILANYNARFKINMTPKTQSITEVDNLLSKMSDSDKAIDKLYDEANMECIMPIRIITIFHLLKDDSDTNPLIGPIRSVNRTKQLLLKPIRQKLVEIKTNIKNTIHRHGLQHLKIIFTLPRIACLIILISGMALAACNSSSLVMTMPTLDPRNIIRIYGAITAYSIINILSTQMTFVEMANGTTIPFYRINVNFDTGFYLDLIADSILLITLIGMKAELFFVIPQKRTVVTYTLPNISPNGAYTPNKIY